MFIAHSYLFQTVKDTIQVRPEKPKEASERCWYLQTEYPYVQASSQDKSAEVDSEATMCPVAPEPTSLMRRAPDPLGGLQSATCPAAPLWTVGLKYKEKPSRPVCAARLVCSQRTRFQGA
jgi:hypothetical protein